MSTPIYANEQHKQTIESFLSVCNGFAQDIGTKSKYQSYQEVLKVIIDYHNNYGAGAKENNYWDWLMIIPINVSVMTQGFFAGIESRQKAGTIRAYRLVLQEVLEDTVNKIEKLDPIKDE